MSADKETFYKRIVFGLAFVLLLAIIWIVAKPNPTSDKEAELEKRLTESQYREGQLRNKLKDAQIELTRLEEQKGMIVNEITKEKEREVVINNQFDEKRNAVVNLPLDESIKFFANWTAGKDSL